MVGSLEENGWLLSICKCTFNWTSHIALADTSISGMSLSCDNWLVQGDQLWCTIVGAGLL